MVSAGNLQNKRETCLESIGVLLNLLRVKMKRPCQPWWFMSNPVDQRLLPKRHFNFTFYFKS